MSMARTRLILLPLAALATVTVGATTSHSVGAATTAASVRHSPAAPRVPHAGIGNAGWSSSNWSGYAVSGGTGAYHAITGAWTVTAVAKSRRATYSSSWIGIDGYNNSNLIQTGTEADYYNGSAHYDAWWEILPAAETVIPSISVRPGDHMTADIHLLSGNSWSITIQDTTTGQSFTTNQTYSGPGTSAEWIEEAPQVGGRVAALANFGEVTFDPGTVNGGNPGLTAAESGVMVQKGVQVSTPSNPDADTDGFNVAYGSSQPSPPAS
jgi:hypothetical protein